MRILTAPARRSEILDQLQPVKPNRYANPVASWPEPISALRRPPELPGIVSPDFSAANPRLLIVAGDRAPGGSRLSCPRAQTAVLRGYAGLTWSDIERGDEIPGAMPDPAVDRSSRAERRDCRHFMLRSGRRGRRSSLLPLELGSRWSRVSCKLDNNHARRRAPLQCRKPRGSEPLRVHYRPGA